MVPNDTARDKTLSFRSRGILALLLSHDDGFNITADGVAKEGTEGRDAVRTSFKELETAGYLRRTKVRDAASGRLSGKVYLYPYGDAPEVDPDITIDEAGSEDEPEPESPGTDFQSSGNQSQADQSYKEDHQENQDAAAVGNEGEQQQQADEDDIAATHAEAQTVEPWQGDEYATRSVAPAADIGLQQPEDKPVETMEEAVSLIKEHLGGQVIAEHFLPADGPEALSHRETPGLPSHDPDGPRAQHHGGNRHTVADDPRPQQPFPAVAYRNLVAWWAPTAQEGAAWEAAWQTADMTSGRGVAGDEFYYDPEAHLMIYLSRTKGENRRPRADLWLRFFIEDRAKHIQTLKQQREQADRRAEDPQQHEERSNRLLPPENWGPPDEANWGPADFQPDPMEG